MICIALVAQNSWHCFQCKMVICLNSTNSHLPKDEMLIIIINAYNLLVPYIHVHAILPCKYNNMVRVIPPFQQSKYIIDLLLGWLRLLVKREMHSQHMRGTRRSYQSSGNRWQHLRSRRRQPGASRRRRLNFW